MKVKSQLVESHCGMKERRAQTKNDVFPRDKAQWL